jgi:DNA polymerase (family X)
VAEATGPAVEPGDVARLLAEIAALTELGGGDPFRARAFAGAARSLEATDADLHALADEGRLTTLKGVGPAIAAVIEEFLRTGRSAAYEELRTATPIGLFDLMRIPGLGTKRIRTLHEELGIDSLDALEAAARAGRIASISGFGAKTEAKILEGIAFARASGGRRRYPEALETAARLVDAVRALPGVLAAEIVGALRRRLEVVDEVELVVAAERPVEVRAALGRLNGLAAAEAVGEGTEARLPDGLLVRVRCVEPAAFVAAVVWETGSESHRDALAARAAGRGMRLDASGLWKGGERVEPADERALYAALGLAYVEPELREGLGEVERAAAGEAPRLVELADLRGAFHCHTTYSDGKATLEEMAEAARAAGWSYLGLGDHSRAAAYAGGMSIQRVREQHREVDRLNAGWKGDATPFRLFSGVESDILPDGSLDYPDDVLESFDYVVGSVHSSFGMSREEMTARVVRAVRHPALTILGHPTGRLLLTRAGYAIDLRAVIDAAAEAGVAIEINANPHRLDLDWREVRQAAERGVLIAINPDAHSTAGLEHVAYGVNMARKAGLGPERILNCWTTNEVERYFAERKQARQA